MTDFMLGPGFRVDLEKLVDTRLLIQANSGGGKSWAIRRLLEQTHGRIQHLVIDPEGEFSTLRERFDYVLAARHHADTVADPRSAKLLAERLLELGASAILDIYELKAHDRIRFVRAFIEALVDAPKKLWRPALVVVDEAHVFAPQQGEAESLGAVIDLATRGRKRGFSAVLATQRLSKLHKDAAAELNNKLIGRTGLDVDIKRAADELGLVGRDASRQLREIEPGHFYAFGPAFGAGVTKCQIGEIKTTHPKAGSRIAFSPPQPTAAIRALLPKLADLPAEAEARQKSLDDLKAENATLKRQLAAKPAPAAPIPAKTLEVPVLSDPDLARIERQVERGFDLAKELQQLGTSIWTEAKTTLEAARAVAAKARTTLPRPHWPDQSVHQPGSRPVRIAFPKNPPKPGTGSIAKGERTILAAIVQVEGATREYLTVATGYKKSSRDTYLQRMSAAGLVSISGDEITATEEGLQALGSDYEPLPTGDELQSYWLNRLPEGERRILSEVLSAYPNAIDRVDLDHATGYKKSSRDTYLQRLTSRKLVKAVAAGRVVASENLFG